MLLAMQRPHNIFHPSPAHMQLPLPLPRPQRPKLTLTTALATLATSLPSAMSPTSRNTAWNARPTQFKTPTAPTTLSLPPIHGLTPTTLNLPSLDRKRRRHEESDDDEEGGVDAEGDKENYPPAKRQRWTDAVGEKARRTKRVVFAEAVTVVEFVVYEDDAAEEEGEAGHHEADLERDGSEDSDAVPRELEPEE